MSPPPRIRTASTTISPLKASRSRLAVTPGRTGMHSQVPPGSAAAAHKPRSPSVGCCARPPAVPARPSRAHTGPHRPVSAEEPSPQSHQEGLGSYGSENNSLPYPHSRWYPPHSRRTRVNHRSEEWTGQVSSLDERQLFPIAGACHAHVATSSQNSGPTLCFCVICILKPQHELPGCVQPDPGPALPHGPWLSSQCIK